MVGKSFDRHGECGIRHQGQWIACFKIALASGGIRYLPRRYRIAAEGIIHPFRNFVAHGRNVRQRGAKNSLIYPTGPYEGLYKLNLRHLAYVKRRVETEHAAFFDVFLRRKKNVRGEGNGESIR